MNRYVFWDTTLCSLFKVNRRFEKVYHLHLLGQINLARYGSNGRSLAELGLFFDTEEVCDIFLRSVELISTDST
jgi:hypothetical protein